jgi:cytochrome c peroxidase
LNRKLLHSIHFNTRNAAFWLIAVILAFYSCKRDDEMPPEPKSTLCPGEALADVGTPYELELPYFMPQPNIPEDNPMTEEGVELGRQLFCDKDLSANNTVSCGSCHAPANAFSDADAQSVGLNGALTRRHSMVLVNIALNTTFFWDGHASTLEEQIFEPVRSHDEMGLPWPEAEERIGSDPEYQDRFTAAFGTPCVDSVRISHAIAQFVRTLISANSKFDKAYRFGTAQLTLSEQRGLELFLAEGGDPQTFPGGQNGGDCFHCHGGALIEFTDHGFHNNGLDSVITGDLGRMEVTGSSLDKGLFKTPTLRNVALSAPYMHDGRLETLHQVVEHYNSGGHQSPTLDPLIKFPDEGLGLSPQDVDDLVNFLETLSDTSFVNNPVFHDPH